MCTKKYIYFKIKMLKQIDETTLPASLRQRVRLNVKE